MKNKIAILSQKNLRSAPRIIREINALQNDFDLILIGDPNFEPSNDIPFFDLYKFRKLKDKVTERLPKGLKRKSIRSSDSANYSGIQAFLENENVKILIIHEPNFLPLAADLKRKSGLKIVYNAHEYHPLEFEDDPEWLKTNGRNYDQLYKKYLSELDLFINVSEGIRVKCIENYHSDSIVIPNAGSYNAIQPTQNKSSRIKLIHHGIIHPSRKIEKMIAVAKLLGSDYQLDIMGMKSKEQEEYYDQILKLTEELENVSFIQPVSFENIVPVLNNYDVGLYYLEPTNFNNQHALPNKIFEFLQAKLAIAVSPSPEMKALVQKHKLGVVAKDFSSEAMAEAIRQLTNEDIDTFKQNCVEAAKTENAEHYQSLFREQILSLLH